MRYCKNCGQNVEPAKKFSFGWFIVNCLWLVGGIVYIFYFLFMKKKVCPMCGADNFEQKHSAEEIQANKANSPQTAPVSKTEQFAANADAWSARVRAKTAENDIKFKAGELPWQIKRAEKKAAKAAKKAAKMAS
jgi:hypothetical protein